MDHIGQAPALQTSIGNITCITEERISVANIKIFRTFGKFRKKSTRRAVYKKHHQQSIQNYILLKTKILPTKNCQICIQRINILQFPAIARTMHSTIFLTQLEAVSYREKPYGVARIFSEVVFNWESHDTQLL